MWWSLWTDWWMTKWMDDWLTTSWLNYLLAYLFCCPARQEPTYWIRCCHRRCDSWPTPRWPAHVCWTDRPSGSRTNCGPVTRHTYLRNTVYSHINWRAKETLHLYSRRHNSPVMRSAQTHFCLVKNEAFLHNVRLKASELTSKIALG